MRTSPRTKEKLLAATTNPGKLREIAAILKDLPLDLLTLQDLGHVAPPPEDGKTFMENARQKGFLYSRLVPFLTLAEDSGLEIDALGGAPGVFSARFAGPDADDQKNNAKVLSLLQEVPPEKRTARFVCCAVVCRQGVLLAEMKGSAEGRITEAPRGRNGFGYDPLFFYPPLGRTFAELTAEEKTGVSHRGQALRLVRDFLLRTLQAK